jgi:AraC family transcriptional regulator
MSQIKWQLLTQVTTDNMLAQIRRHYWPAQYDEAVDRDRYYVSLCSASDLSLRKAAAGKATTLSTGTLSVLPPRLPVRIHMREGWDKSYVCVFHPAYFEEVTGLGEFWYDEELEAYSNIRTPAIVGVVKRIFQEVEHPGFASSLLVESAGNLALVELARYVREVRRRPQERLRSEGLAPWQLKRINGRIAASLELGSPGLQELAQLCRISEFHMMRNFKRSTGTTLHRYIELVRLENAKQMLAEDHLSIKYIALRLGFNSPAYFSTAFRRLSGMSPTEYREGQYISG